MSVVRVLQLVIFLIPIFTLAQTRVASHPLEVSKNRAITLQSGSTAPDAYELVLNARATAYKGAGIYGETVFYFNTAFYIGAYFKEKQQYQIFKYNK